MAHRERSAAPYNNDAIMIHGQLFHIVDGRAVPEPPKEFLEQVRPMFSEEYALRIRGPETREIFYRAFFQ